MLFKQPLMGDRRLPIEPRFPAHCQEASALPPVVTGDALISRGEIVCEPALVGSEIAIDGLDRTLTDVLVRVEWLDGESTSHLMRPERRSFELQRGEGGGHTAAAVSTYLVLGVEHLLFGFDHILFVIGLLFFVRRPIELLKVITAFTVAHSITLAMSVLGMARLPQGPVEAVIALSILYLAVELAREHFGSRDGSTEVAAGGGFMHRFPWTVAFGFGLLHGFGFAGALGEIGLPESAVGLALFLFNLGVEIGQLLVVFVILFFGFVLRKARLEVPQWVYQVPIWLMGTVSAFWFIERVVGLLP